MVGRMAERRFPRDFASLEAIYAFVREFLAGHHLSGEHAWNLDLIVEELFTNVVKYGAGSDPVAISLDWQAPTVTMRIQETGPNGFDPTRAPAVDVWRPIEERRAGGLGIHLVRQIADRFEFDRNGTGSVITIAKRLEP
jgi:anti-sigma regulatory factor (Ser/Thr protein kinase)